MPHHHGLSDVERRHLPGKPAPYLDVGRLTGVGRASSQDAGLGQEMTQQLVLAAQADPPPLQSLGEEPREVLILEEAALLAQSPTFSRSRLLEESRRRHAIDLAGGVHRPDPVSAKRL